MKRVLHINDYPCDFPRGGTEVVMARTISLLREAGYRVDTFSSADLPDPTRTIRRYLHNPVAVRALKSKLASFVPDLVHLHNVYHLLSPAVLAVLDEENQRRRLPVVMSAHDYHFLCPNAGGTWRSLFGAKLRPFDFAGISRIPYLATRLWDQRGLGYSLLKTIQHVWHYRINNRRTVPDVVLCPSRNLMNWLKPSVRRVEFLPPPNPPAPTSAYTKPGQLQLIFVGRLEPEKGLLEFFRAFPSDFVGTMKVVGDGSQRTRLVQILQQRRLAAKIEMTGALPHAAALDAVAASHVLVLPSLCLESYGLTLIEALSRRTNILVSDHGAMRELVEASGIGYRFNPDDPANLTARLCEIVAAFANGTLNAFNADAFLAGRDTASYANRLIEIYEDLMEYGGEAKLAA